MAPGGAHNHRRGEEVAVLRISAYSSRQLQAIIVAGKQAPRELQKRLRTETKAVVDPVWRKAVTEHASTRLEQRVLGQTARVAVSNQNVTLKAAVVGKKLSGGLNPKTQYHAAEFGAEQGRFNTYSARSKRGHRFDVRRRTTNQLRPLKRTGYVVYPAAADVIPRIASLWFQTAARQLHEIFEAR